MEGEPPCPPRLTHCLRASWNSLEDAAALRAEGKTWAQLATELDTDGEKLRKLVRRSGRVYWTLFEEAQFRASMEAAARARATLTKLLGSEDERVALRAAQTLMADDRGRKKNAVLAEKNDIVAGNMEKKRRNSESWAQLRDAEMTLAACRRAENRNRNRRCTQIHADGSLGRGGAPEVSPAGVSAEN